MTTTHIFKIKNALNVCRLRDGSNGELIGAFLRYNVLQLYLVADFINENFK